MATLSERLVNGKTDDSSAQADSGVRYILRKYVDAASASDALALDASTPVHDIYLKDGEEPKRDEKGPRDLIGFWYPAEPSFGWVGEPQGKKK